MFEETKFENSFTGCFNARKSAAWKIRTVVLGIRKGSVGAWKISINWRRRVPQLFRCNGREHQWRRFFISNSIEGISYIRALRCGSEKAAMAATKNFAFGGKR